MEKSPLLSICIPTFSRSELLKSCLASVLPQVACYRDLVECIVSDNASTDDTDQVVRHFASRFPVRSHRNDTNLGVIGNITLAATRLARGEFVWLVGDDDVLAVSAVKRVIDFLQQFPEVELLAVNTGFLPEKDRPQEEACVGGYSNDILVVARHSAKTGPTDFASLLEGPPVDLTAMYAVVLRRKYWCVEYDQPFEGPQFIDVRSTYPTTCVIGKHMTKLSAGILAEPVVVTFDRPSELFSWSHYHALVTVLHLTSVFRMLENSGVSRKVLEPYYRYQLDNRGHELGDLCWNRETAGTWRDALSFAWMMRSYPAGILKLFLIAASHPKAPSVFRIPLRSLWRIRNRVAGRADPNC